MYLTQGMYAYKVRRRKEISPSFIYTTSAAAQPQHTWGELTLKTVRVRFRVLVLHEDTHRNYDTDVEGKNQSRKATSEDSIYFHERNQLNAYQFTGNSENTL